MSEFALLFRGTRPSGPPEHTRRHVEQWVAWFRELGAKGLIKDPGQPLEDSGRIVQGKPSLVSDSPYVEGRDMIAGYTVIEANDLAHAAELSKGCPILDIGGCVEVRPVQRINISTPLLS